MNCPHCKSVKVYKRFGPDEIWCHSIYDGPITNAKWEFWYCSKCKRVFIVPIEGTVIALNPRGKEV